MEASALSSELEAAMAATYDASRNTTWLYNLASQQNTLVCCSNSGAAPWLPTDTDSPVAYLRERSGPVDATYILAHVMRLAGHPLKPSTDSSAGAEVILEAPWTLEVTPRTFAVLHRLLESLSGQETAASFALVATIHILNIHVGRVRAFKGDAATMAALKVPLAAIHATILRLVQRQSDTAVRSALWTTLARGAGTK